MDVKKAAEAIAELVTAISEAGGQGRRTLLTGLYKALQEAGLSEPDAGALQHHIARATDGIVETGTATGETDNAA